MRRALFLTVAVLLWGAALLYSAGCATALVNADAALHRSISVTQDTADALCDSAILEDEACRLFNVRLIIILQDAKAFNRAVRENNYGEVPAMLRALVGLRDEVLALIKDPAIRDSIIERINSAYSLISALRK